MFLSLRSRLLFTYSLIIGVILVIIGSVLMIYLIRNPSQNAHANLRIQAAMRLLINLEKQRENNQISFVFEDALRVDQAFDVRVVIFLPNGYTIVDSREGNSKVSLPAIIQNNRRDEFPSILTYRDSSEQLWSYSVRTLNRDRVLMISTPRPRLTLQTLIRQRGDPLFSLLIQTGLVTLLLALILAYGMARWVISPLEKMAQASRNIDSGEYFPLPLEGPAEVRSYGRAFNEMISQVKASQQSQRDFVANVSHELKTPLTSIQGFSQAIIDGTADTEEVILQAVEVINNEADRMHRMVVELLDLARLDAGTMEFQRTPVDMMAMLIDVIEKLSPQAANAQVKIKIEHPTLPTLIGDEERLSQVFTNLIDNAIKYSPNGGLVSIDATSLDGKIQVSITDNGPGISADELPRIFERFYQIDKSRTGGSYRGAGLGLAIAHEIIHAHSGTISVQSKPDRGSVFVVRIPVARPDDTTIVTRRAA